MLHQNSKHALGHHVRIGNAIVRTYCRLGRKIIVSVLKNEFDVLLMLLQQGRQRGCNIGIRHNAPIRQTYGFHKRLRIKRYPHFITACAPCQPFAKDQTRHGAKCAVACTTFISFAKVFFCSPFLFQKKSKLLACLFDRNCNCNSHTYHGVVTCTDETHHLYVKMTAVEETAFIIKKNRYCTHQFIDVSTTLYHLYHQFVKRNKQLSNNYTNKLKQV